MNAASKDIQEMLEADSSVDHASYPISRGTMVEDRANCTAITDFPGGQPQLTMDAAKYEFPSIQVKVRCSDYDAGLAFIQSIKDSLHGRANETWNETLYTLIYCLNDPGFLDRVNQRTTFVANFNLQRRLA